ncbi:hypothetical protein EV421DRAFT_1908465 [Armillaria borealis]|uniref:DUF6534 domain-containing protein n=1 Tax=Armillaria borealis TaxID=47425 RepID=A0AA39J5M8_9AGAR|nr:hypothetical protein EV421DRAFT_1908465 [Armillaria borealis]
MSLQPSTASPPVGDTLGALYIGSIIAAVLFGITNLQVVIYYKKYPDDWWFYRYSMGFLCFFAKVLDALHVTLSTHALYFYLIDMYGDLMGALESNNLSMKLQLDVNVVIAVYVQGYKFRCYSEAPKSYNALGYMLSGYGNALGAHFHKVLLWFVLLTVAASLGAAIFVVYDISIVPSLIAASTIKTAIYTFSSTVAAADVIIALVMSYYLRKGRASTGFSSTASLILGLMQLVIASGLATSACSILTLITFIVLPESLVFLGIHFALSKLYINSILAMLNYRREKQVNKPNAEPGRHSISAILRITPHSMEGSTEEAASTTWNIGIPLTEIQDVSSLDDKLNHSKGTFDC